MPEEDAKAAVGVAFALGVGVAALFATDRRFRAALYEVLALAAHAAAISTGERAPVAVGDGELVSRRPYRPPGERIP